MGLGNLIEDEGESFDTSINTTEIFDSIVNNAIDFLTRSVSELKKYPKYSTIDFYTSIELFLKARLVRIDWRSIFTKEEEANVLNLKNGDFNSVSLEEACKRLNKKLPKKIPSLGKDCFARIGKRRNRVVHFFHPEYDNFLDKENVYELVAEQCKGWFYLHKLLTEDWKLEFEEHLSAISKLNQLMHGHREFLKAKFQALLPSINQDRQKGILISRCSSCDFKSLKAFSLGPLEWSQCLVCGLLESRQLRVPCCDCNNDILVRELAQGICETCDESIDINYIIEFL